MGMGMGIGIGLGIGVGTGIGIGIETVKTRLIDANQGCAVGVGGKGL